MRVLMINLGYPPNVVGGAELFVQALSRELVRNGIRTRVASLSQNGTDWDCDDDGVRAYFMNAHPMGIALLNPRRTTLQRVAWHALGEANIWVKRKLGAIIEAERPDIVHTHSLLGLSVSAWWLARARRVPIVHTLHDYQLLCPRGTMFRNGCPCPRQCRSCAVLTARRRWASRLPAAVVGISDFSLKTHVARGYFPSAIRATVPHSAVSSDAAEGLPQPSGGPLRIGFIGGLQPSKGAQVLLQALRHLPCGSYVAKIAGSGRAEHETCLRNLANGLPVEFMGWVRRDDFYRGVDIVVVPTISPEPLGMAVIEAASFRVPAVYSNRGGVGEIGARIGAGVAFDPADPISLSGLLVHLIETRGAVRHLKASIRPIPPEFEIGGCAGIYRHLYQEILRNNAPSSSSCVNSLATVRTDP